MLQTIEALAQTPTKKHVSRVPILNKKIKWVKFTKHIIVISEFRN